MLLRKGKDCLTWMLSHPHSAEEADKKGQACSSSVGYTNPARSLKTWTASPDSAKRAFPSTGSGILAALGGSRWKLRFGFVSCQERCKLHQVLFNQIWHTALYTVLEIKFGPRISWGKQCLLESYIIKKLANLLLKLLQKAKKLFTVFSPHISQE